MVRKKLLTLAILSLLVAALTANLIPGTVSASKLHVPIYISGDGGFTAANGVTWGTGAVADPYIIEGWDINASSANGIEIHNTNSYFIIRSVTVHSGGIYHNGIYLASVNNGAVQNAVVSDNYRGVFVWMSSRITLWAGTTYSNRVDGVSLLSSSLVTIASWNVSHNLRDGIRVFSSSLTNVTGNNVSSNQASGIVLYDSTNVTLAVNKVDSNAQAGVSLSASTDNIVYHNTITSNGEQAYDDLGAENLWDRGYPSGGNYWSDYTGQDNCNGASQSVCTGPDGIGDTPYAIDPDSQDRYPMMTPFHDLVRPTWTTGSNLAASAVGAYDLTLTWTQATDDHVVAGYRLYQDGILRATLPGTMRSLTVTGLTPLTLYTFKIEAGDQSDNWTQDGPSATVKTSSLGGGGGSGSGRFFRI